MTREEAIRELKIFNGTTRIRLSANFWEAHNMAIEALEMVEEFEKAQIITGGRLNGRTYAYKCGLEDGKRKALEQETSKDAVSRKAMLDAITEIDENINMDIYTNEVREIIRELPPVTPARKVGKWLSAEEYALRLGEEVTEDIKNSLYNFCPFCEQTVFGNRNYCPNCGAEMESKNEYNRQND